MAKTQNKKITVFVKAKTGARENKLIPPMAQQPGLWKEEKEDSWHIVFTKALPEKGKANDAIKKILARHFHVGQSEVKLMRGSTSKQKVFVLPKV
ncbi:MAG: DUF167 domain-containing protein [Parcubacteria group bacterium]